MAVRWGIIGCGDVCEVKSGPPLYQVPSSSLTIVMRRDLAAAQDFARRHGVVEATDNAERVMQHSQVDAVYIATPPGSHCEFALAVAQLGKPCYVEKPMARNATECRRMVEAFGQARQPLFVAYYRRALPRFLRVQDILQSGQLGSIRTIYHTYQGRAARSGQPAFGPENLGWRESVAVSGGGLFLDLGSHVLDLMDFLLGPLTQVRGQASRRRAVAKAAQASGSVAPEDTVVACFRVGEQGVLGGLRHQYHTAQAVDRLEIVGDVGSLELSVFGTEAMRLTMGERTTEIETEQPAHVQEPLIRSIVAELNGSATRCLSTGQSALRTSQAMDQILDAYYGGRDDEFWAACRQQKVR